MSGPSLNITQEAQVLGVLFKSTVSSVVPLMLLESFLVGVLCACVPLGTYFLWIKSHSFPRTHFILVFWIALATIILHWAGSLRQFESTISGRSLEFSVSPFGLADLLLTTPVDNDDDIGLFVYYSHIEEAYSACGEAWVVFFPLVTETVLFGFSSTLFVISAYASFRHHRSQRRSCSTLLIPVMALSMYTLSLAHWIVSHQLFVVRVNSATAPPSKMTLAFGEEQYHTVNSLEAALLTLFSLNVVMSDSIVLWRMCVVWDRARPVLALSALFLLAITGLNFANIIEVAGLDVLAAYTVGIIVNKDINNDDREIAPTYGKITIGFGAAFVSLASNLSATVLVWIRIWLNKRKFRRHPHTFIERFMELLVDSGVLYTTVWLLFCVSLFRPVTIQEPLGTDSSPATTITAVSQLDAAMAQITSIYPLIIFIIVALDRFHHSRGPQVLVNDESLKERDHAVTVTFEIDVERSVAQIPGSAYPMVDHQHADDDSSAKEETRLSGF